MREVEEEGIGMCCSGFAKRASSCDAVCDFGERARRFLGGGPALYVRFAEAGMDSGIGSDIVDVFVW